MIGVMDGEQSAEEAERWLPIPEPVAAVLGQLVYYAAWLDDVLGEAVVLGNPLATEAGDSTPGWASSGKALVQAVRSIQIDHPFIGDFADRLDRLNKMRNQFVHGVWLWRDDAVLILKRSLDKGPRLFDYVTYSYQDLEQIVAEYQALGKIADRLITVLMDARRDEIDWLRTPNCPNDLLPMKTAIQNGVIVWKCHECGLVKIL
jgi:hypothetical protein